MPLRAAILRKKKGRKEKNIGSVVPVGPVCSVSSLCLSSLLLRRGITTFSEALLFHYLAVLAKGSKL